MQREKQRIYFTEEDKQNIVIKKYAESEVGEKVKAYKKKRSNRRIVYAIIFAVLIAATRAEWDWLLYWTYIAICFMIFLTLVYEHIDRMELKVLSLYLYYIEIYVEKKLPRESCPTPAANQGSFAHFYPVEGRDTSSGYKSIFYIDKKQYMETDMGKKVRKSLSKGYAEKLISYARYN